MTPHSLRLRLILVSALGILLTLSVAGVALSQLFANHLERAQVSSLTDDLNRLAALVEADVPELDISQPMADPRFASPYGGIYWQIEDPQTGATKRSRSMWDKSFDTARLALSGTEPTRFNIVDPEGEPAVGVGRLLTFALDNGQSRPLRLVVVEDNVDVETAIAAYRFDLFRALTILGVLLVLANWAQVTLGLAPLNAIRKGLSAIRAGRSATLAGDFPAEVVPLVAEVNDLMQAQELAIQFARERAADLAHGLKGKLQVLNAEAHELRSRGDVAAAEAIESLTAEMADAIDHQLGLSRLRRRSPQSGKGTDISAVTGKIVRAVGKTTRGAELTWTTALEPNLLVLLDRSDLSELLGALIENAAKWASHQVRVTTTAEPGFVIVQVEDDGPGMTAEQIEQVGTRGVRLDEARSGTGIGVSIVREIASLNSGRLEFGRSALGGLLVKVALPAALPAH